MEPWPAPKEAPYEPPPGLNYAYEAAQEWVAAQQGAPFCLVDLEKFLLEGGHQVGATNGACGRICGNGTIRRLKDGRWIATGEPDPPPEKAPPTSAPTSVAEEQDPGAPPPEPAGEDDPLDGVLPEPDKWGRWKHGNRIGWHLRCPPCGRPGHNCSTCPSCREQEAMWRRKHPEGVK